ncbi:MAG: helix-turn-helix transcriptional regulator [Armatimonadetes bacterium]|nr:helix-turn-helix transcriptional regulator [Armatimonadota bacterium]
MPGLSSRERELLGHASEGLTDEAIAAKLEISVATVRGYWLRIKAKLGGNGRAQLVGQWVQLNSDATDVQTALDNEQAKALRQTDFEEALAQERKETDEVYGHLDVGQKAEIAKIRERTDAAIVFDREESKSDGPEEVV